MIGKRELPGLPGDVRLTLFRAVERVLRNDATLRNALGPDRIRAWSGAPGDAAPLQASAGAMVRITPQFDGERFFTPDHMTGSLIVAVEIAVRGWNVEDPIALWAAIERAFYPSNAPATSPPGPSPRLVVQQQLKAAGAHTGEATFRPPSPANADGQWYGSGVLSIEYRNQFTAIR